MNASPGDCWTILRVLTWTTGRFQRDGLASPRLDAEILLAHCLGVDRVRLYVEHDKPLHPDELVRFRAAVRRRLAREPVAYITGTREFWSMPLQVDKHVLIPRPETEVLEEQAIEMLGQMRVDVPVVVDVGTGSGAVALALAREVSGARVMATDIAPRALEVAAANAIRLGLVVTFYQGDLLDALPREVEDIDLVVANPPYVSTAELDRLEPEIARWEPRQALDGGADGLAVYRRLIRQVINRLAPGGAVAFEIGAEQATDVRGLLAGSGFGEVVVRQDLAGLDRVVVARTSPSS